MGEKLSNALRTLHAAPIAYTLFGDATAAADCQGVNGRAVAERFRKVFIHSQSPAAWTTMEKKSVISDTCVEWDVWSASYLDGGARDGKPGGESKRHR